MCVSPRGPVDPRTYDDQIIGVSNEVEDNYILLNFGARTNRCHLFQKSVGSWLLKLFKTPPLPAHNNQSYGLWGKSKREVRFTS
jgi:hypothetical protein